MNNLEKYMGKIISQFKGEYAVDLYDAIYTCMIMDGIDNPGNDIYYEDMLKWLNAPAYELEKKERETLYKIAKVIEATHLIRNDNRVTLIHEGTVGANRLALGIHNITLEINCNSSLSKLKEGKHYSLEELGVY